MKTVLVACGAAVVTSTIVARKIEQIAEEHHIPCQTVQAKAKEVFEKVKVLKPDVIVCTCQLEGEINIPVINGRAFLTGVDMASMTEKLLEILK